MKCFHVLPMSFVLSFMRLAGSVSIKALDEIMIFLPARYEAECRPASGLMEWQSDKPTPGQETQRRAIRNLVFHRKLAPLQRWHTGTSFSRALELPAPSWLTQDGTNVLSVWYEICPRQKSQTSNSQSHSKSFSITNSCRSVSMVALCHYRNSEFEKKTCTAWHCLDKWKNTNSSQFFQW